VGTNEVNMHGFILATMGEAFMGGLGVAAAILLVGGWVLLQWQRQRHRFDLIRSSLERGTPLPQGTPLWLISLRQGLLTLTLGVGLLIVGAAARAMVSGVAMPPASVFAAAVQAAPAPPPPPESDRFEPRRPPPPNPVVEQWHQAQAQRAVGQIAMGCGVILVLLGAVRAGLASTERRYAVTAPPTSSPAEG
jgi:hypothetical protein